VDKPATAVILPVSVRVQTTAPELATVGALKAAVNPFGNPEAMPIVDPAAPPATAMPPAGVATNWTCAEERDLRDTDPGDTASVTPGACATWIVNVLLPETPSPFAVTLTVPVPTEADGEAVKVSVDEPLSALSVTGLLVHEAVTPGGNPLTLKVTTPL